MMFGLVIIEQVEIILNQLTINHNFGIIHLII
jgi:hypothetical protein